MRFSREAKRRAVKFTSSVWHRSSHPKLAAGSLSQDCTSATMAGEVGNLVAGIVGVLMQRNEARRQAALAEASAEEARAARARAEVEAASSDQIARVLSGAFNLTSDIAGPPADVTGMRRTAPKP